MTPPGVKARSLPRDLYPQNISYKPEELRRQDESPDTQWYSQPRFVQHIDDGAIATLKSYYASIIKSSDSVLDLCSSWVSHLPENMKPHKMVGIGMNAAELSANKHLSSHFVRDLNTDPTFKEIGDGEMDVVICNVSVDYLVKPIEVFREMRRVLKVGGTAHMAFSNRCFPTKVVGAWLGMGDEARRRWVGGYFWASGGWGNVEEVVLKEGNRGLWEIGGEDPLFVVRAKKASM